MQIPARFRTGVALAIAGAVLVAVSAAVLVRPGSSPSATASSTPRASDARSPVSSASPATSTSPSAASTAATASAESLAPSTTAPPAPTPDPTPAPTPAPSPRPTVKPTATPPQLAIQHVFVVVMENQDFADILGSSSTPYTTGLAERYAYADNYDAIEHPSLGNYLDMTGGTSAGTSGDCSPSGSCHVGSPNLVDLLEARGITWKGYFESMDTPCRTSDSSSGAYEAHHNPFVYFDSIRNDPSRCASHTVDYSKLAADLGSSATTPNFAFIVPSGPTHNGSHSISGGDDWLSANLPAILHAPACSAQSCLLVLTWDEDNYSGRNQVLTVFAGSAARRGHVSSVAYDHFSLLRTVESIFGVGTLTAHDAAAKPMSDMLK